MGRGEQSRFGVGSGEWVGQGKECRETAGGGGGYGNFTAKKPAADWNLITGNVCAEVSGESGLMSAVLKCWKDR